MNCENIIPLTKSKLPLRTSFLRKTSRTKLSQRKIGSKKYIVKNNDCISQADLSSNKRLTLNESKPNNSNINPRNYDDLLRIAGVIRRLSNLKEVPQIGIICGSGLGDLADEIKDTIILQFADIPGFPKTNVVGHKGNLVFGWLCGTYVMCLQGRFHPYEHNMDLALCSMPIRLMNFLGVQTLIVSNAAGGLNDKYKHGDIMVINDQIFLPGISGFSPLIGMTDPRFGERFVSMHNAYDKTLRKMAALVASELNINVKEGVYVMCGGPQYETPTEISFLKKVGGDAVGLILKNYGLKIIGMSTCHEVTVARQCGMRVFGFSLITNVCNTDVENSEEITHAEVLKIGKEASKLAKKLVAGIIHKLKIENSNTHLV